MTGPARFRAEIQTTGVNPFVLVPERVSERFRPHARSGRITVEGTLSSTPVRGTLVPVAGGRHRFYINGGMRSAAGVGVGDRVTLSLRPVPVEKLTTPRDLAAALRAVEGARAAFDALSASHRRELVRFIDDARTPATRARRIDDAVGHVLGRPKRRASSPARSRPMWTCPRCGREFVNRNSYHSCVRYRLSDPFRGRPGSVRALFDALRALIERNGPVKLVPYRDRVGFMVRVRFAGASPKRDRLDVSFWLTRRLTSARIHRIETLYPDAHVHTVRISHAGELDDELASWLSEAYRIGRQEHLA